MKLTLQKKCYYYKYKLQINNCSLIIRNIRLKLTEKNIEFRSFSLSIVPKNTIKSVQTPIGFVTCYINNFFF